MQIKEKNMTQFLSAASFFFSGKLRNREIKSTTSSVGKWHLKFEFFHTKLYNFLSYSKVSCKLGKVFKRRLFIFSSFKNIMEVYYHSPNPPPLPPPRFLKGGLILPKIPRKGAMEKLLKGWRILRRGGGRVCRKGGMLLVWVFCLAAVWQM